MARLSRAFRFDSIKQFSPIVPKALESSTSTLESLGDDCLVEICTHLQFKDIIALAATCRSLQSRLNNSSRFWKNLVVAKYPFIQADILVSNSKLLFQYCEEFSSLWIDICPSIIPLKSEKDLTLGVYHCRTSFLVASGHSVKSLVLRENLFEEVAGVNFRSRCVCTAWNSSDNALLLGFQDGAIVSWKGKQKESVVRFHKKVTRAVSCIEVKAYSFCVEILKSVIEW